MAGPTASGKSDVALQLVERLRDRGESPEIVAMDSMTLYRGMDIGTAKPTRAEQELVPHHLFDLLNVDQTYCVADYVAAASQSAAAILGRGGTPIFVGGTGLYLRSLLRGVFDGPPGDPEIRKRLTAEWNARGAEAMHSRLAAVDPATAGRLAVNDGRRIMRALEVLEVSGRPISEFQSEEAPDEVARRVFWLEPDRSELHRRINGRVDRMIAAGWLDEARSLLNGSHRVGPTARQALGYQELFGVIEEGDDLATVIERIKARTRQFAKRQHTWFRNLEECRAIGVDPSDSVESVTVRLLQAGSMNAD